MPTEKKVTKELIQEQSVNLSRDHPNLLIKHATGSGKTLSFIKIQEELKPNSVYVVIAERSHKQNIIDEYKKHGKEHLLKNVVFFCYASLHKYINTNVDMLCLDEGHHISSDNRLDCLSLINAKNIIILSATIKESILKRIEEIKGPFYNYYIPLKEAIEYEVVPKPTFYLVPLELNNVKSEIIIFTRGKKNKQKEIHCEFKDRFRYMSNKKIYPDLHLVVRCTQFQKEQFLSNTYNYYKSRYFNTRNIFDKNKWLYSGIERKRYLADIKTSVVQTIINKLQDTRFVCFCGSIKQARILSNSKNIICSEIKNVDQIISDFNDSKINNLFVVDMLKEGTNLNNVESGIIVQLDGDSGPFIQKSGRIMRSKNPIIILLYYKNTKDEEYLNNILKEIDIENIRVIDNVNNFKI